VKTLTIKTVGEDGKLVTLRLEDASGAAYELPLNSMDAQSLIGILSVQLTQLAASSDVQSRAALNTKHLQLVESGETLSFRVFLAGGAFHEYQVEANTTLAQGLLQFFSHEAARQEEKQTGQTSGAKH